MNNLLYLIPLLPLIGFAIIGLGNRSLSKGLTTVIACGTVGVSFLLSAITFFSNLHQNEAITLHLTDWITSGSFNVGLSFMVDHLTNVFLLVITGVGFLIHVYSAGYMHDDEGFRRFFAYLNLFVFFMLVLVMGDSLLLMFVGWEGVGLCSYLLIGFWFKVENYNNAARKAFVMNRIGDLGFLLGIILLFLQFGSVNYSTLTDASLIGSADSGLLTAAAILLFIGAMGKSAQIPLYTWLPDAMAGPTPVSALIHAATMVTAGIYMVARTNLIFSASPIAMNLVLFIGLATALLGASIGLFQNDIKKVLAYSTVSQLGLMFAALGAGAFTAAVFHVMTHAFFKALLFLGAGSVIHAMSGEQDIRKMGGLKKALPITYMTFLIGTLAISGIPPFAGFFSKDQILAELLYQKGGLIFGTALLVSLMTCFYMFRLLFVTFFGSFRGSHEQKHHLHESPSSMTLPLMILAVLSIVGGMVGFPHGIGHSLGISHVFDHYLESSLPLSSTHFTAEQEWMMIGGTLLLIGLVIYMALRTYIYKASVPEEDDSIDGFKKVVYNKYYIDEVYEKTIMRPLNGVSESLYAWIDRAGLDGLVNGTGRLVRGLGNELRVIQSGNLGSYLLAIVLAMIVILIASIY